MAQPITWRDVAPPNQTGNLLATQQAGKQITQALSGLADIPTSIRNTAREEATRAAVASIQNASDPVAAAAAVPQDWTIDPLAVANAANTRGQQVLQNRAAEASLKASEVSTQTNQAQLDNIVSDREAARLASAGIDKYRENKGKLPTKEELTKVGWDFTKDNANKAYSQLLSYDNNQQQLTLQKTQAAQQNKLFQENEATKRLQGDIYDFNASGQAKTLDPNELDKVYREFAKARGLTSAAIPGALPYAQAGSSQAVLSSEQRAAHALPLAALSTAQQAAELDKAAAVAEFNSANETATVMAKSPFAGKTPGEIRSEGAKAVGIDETDFGQRITAVERRAAKLGDTKLTPAQTADIARLNPTGFFDTDTWGWSDAAQGLMEKYLAFNKLGPDGLAVLQKQKVLPATNTVARLAQDQAKFEGAILTGKDTPQSVVNLTREFTNRQTFKAAKQVTADADSAIAEFDKAQKERERKRLADSIAFSGNIN